MRPTITFYKVIVISVGLYESEIIDEKHFSDLSRAKACKQESVDQGFIAIIVEV